MQEGRFRLLWKPPEDARAGWQSRLNEFGWMVYGKTMTKKQAEEKVQYVRRHSPKWKAQVIRVG